MIDPTESNIIQKQNQQNQQNQQQNQQNQQQNRENQQNKQNRENQQIPNFPIDEIPNIIYEVPELLQQLEQQHLLWGIVTNKPALYTDALIPLIGLAHASCVISGDTTAHAKPHPEPMIEAARRIKLAPHLCWYVGDDLRDIQAGKAAGMPTIAAAWGYCGNTEPQSWNADYIANTPSDLLKLLAHAQA